MKVDTLEPGTFLWMVATNRKNATVVDRFCRDLFNWPDVHLQTWFVDTYGEIWGSPAGAAAVVYSADDPRLDDVPRIPPDQQPLRSDHLVPQAVRELFTSLVAEDLIVNIRPSSNWMPWSGEPHPGINRWIVRFVRDANRLMVCTIANDPDLRVTQGFYWELDKHPLKQRTGRTGEVPSTNDLDSISALARYLATVPLPEPHGSDAVTPNATAARPGDRPVNRGATRSADSTRLPSQRTTPPGSGRRPPPTPPCRPKGPRLT